MRWMLILLVVESFLWGGNSNYAKADIIGFQFSGSWTEVDPAFTNLTGGVGQPLTGSIYYDSTIIAANKPNQKQAYYYGSDSQTMGLSFTTDTTSVKISQARIAIFAHSVISNNCNSPKSEFQLWFNTDGGPGQATSSTFLPTNTNGSFLLYDTTKEYFTNDELPSTINPLQAMLTGSFTLSLPNQPGQFPPKAVAQINSITPLPVPEPESIILLCSGLSLIFFCRRFNNRKGGLQKLRA